MINLLNTRVRAASGMVWGGAFLLIFTLALSVHSYAAMTEIHNASDFEIFCNDVHSGETVTLQDNIALDHVIDYASISNVTFDGNGHSITLNNVTTGLFDSIESNAKVINLTLLGDINSDQDSGGIANFNYGTIENCRNKANVTVNKDLGSNAIGGGIAGSNGGTITNCTNEGILTVSCNNSVVYAGGIAGEQDLNGKIEYCMNSGPINVTNKSSDPDRKSYVGGIAGFLSDLREEPDSIKSCLNSADITVSSNTAILQGGIIGKENNQNNISDCVYLAGTSDTGAGEYKDSQETDETIHVISLIEDDLLSGKATYFLNGRTSSASTWKQELGTDDYPVLDNSKPDVLEVSYNDRKLYANEIRDDSTYIVKTDTEDYTFDVYLDTTKYGGEGAKYLEAVAVVENGTTYPVTNYKLAESPGNFIIFPVKTNDTTYNTDIKSLVVAKKNAESTVNLGFIGSAREVY